MKKKTSCRLAVLLLMVVFFTTACIGILMEGKYILPEEDERFPRDERHLKGKFNHDKKFGSIRLITNVKRFV